MKGSLTAYQFADIVENGFKAVDSDSFSIKRLPVADGGDGTFDVLVNAFGLNNKL